MLIVLVLRNVLRNLPRLVPMIVIIVAVFAAMVLGNAVLAASGDSLYRTYARLVSGDLSVGAVSESNFTIFGSDQLLIGEYLVPETLSHYPDLAREVAGYPEVRAAAGLVSVSGAVDVAGTRATRTLFGIDGDEYAALFPDLDVPAGEFPRGGEAGIVLQDDGTPPDDRIGGVAVITAQTGRTFTIREVPVTGIFSYPVDDSLLNTVALVDVETARSLAGYTYGAAEEGESFTLDADDESALGGDVDDLFGGSDGENTDDDSGIEDGGIDLDALLGGGGDGGADATAIDTVDADSPADDASTAVDASGSTIPGAWNFLLVSLHDPADRGTVMGRLEDAGYTEENGYRVRDWYRTVGGNASLVRYLQILFNAGLVFVAIGAAIVATNALVLSVLERTKEIGTMRALGGGHLRIGGMIALETLIVVTGAGLVGIALGAWGVDILNGADLVIENQYIEILFGGRPIRGAVSLSLVVDHIAAAIGLAAVSVLYPLKRAFAVSPREAMAA